VSPSIRRGQSHLSHECLIAGLRVDEIEDGFVLQKDERRRMLFIRVFEKRKGVVSIAEIRVLGRDIER